MNSQSYSLSLSRSPCVLATIAGRILLTGNRLSNDDPTLDWNNILYYLKKNLQILFAELGSAVRSKEEQPFLRSV